MGGESPAWGNVPVPIVGWGRSQSSWRRVGRSSLGSSNHVADPWAREHGGVDVSVVGWSCSLVGVWFGCGALIRDKSRQGLSSVANWIKLCKWPIVK
jgi:hypothetical protein